MGGFGPHIEEPLTCFTVKQVTKMQQKHYKHTNMDIKQGVQHKKHLLNIC
jgi:hypothetical protein